MTIVDIKPVSKSLTQLQILGVNVRLDNSASISYSVVGDAISESGVLDMDSATYAQWGTDDQFVVDWALAELGLEKA